MVPRTRFVAYYRVSTGRQGLSGLGLAAQRAAVMAHLGGRQALVAEMVEIESGRRDDRPELARAIAACRLHGATLVIARLDRLARNVAFVSSLMASGVEFVAVDFPQANRLTVHILAAVAEHEREMISARTRAALAAARARGRRLGNPANLANRAAGAARSALVRRAAAAERARMILPLIEAVRGEGPASLRRLADELNRRGVPAPRGGRWFAATVRRVLLAAR